MFLEFSCRRTAQVWDGMSKVVVELFDLDSVLLHLNPLYVDILTYF